MWPPDTEPVADLRRVADPRPTDADDAELEAAARQVLHPAVFDYYAGGAGDESALVENLAAWRRLRLRPRVLRATSGVDTSVTVLGTSLAAPIAIAPMGLQRLAHDDGERATAAAAAAAGVAMTLSSYATCSVEDVAGVAPEGARWFQSYVLTDRGLTAELLHRAAASGYRAVLLTVDAAAAGDRRRDRRHGFVLPHSADVTLANLREVRIDAAYSAQLDTDLGPDVIEWVRETSGLPVAVKGILHPDDARLCVDSGADGIVVSNHGGRQLDAAIATADALPDIVAAVAGAADVLVDGGVRSGADIVRALALGARAVLIGRPVLYALAVGGRDGVTELLRALREDLDRCLRMCGASRLTDLAPDLLAP